MSQNIINTILKQNVFENVFATKFPVEAKTVDLHSFETILCCQLTIWIPAHPQTSIENLTLIITLFYFHNAKEDLKCKRPII